LRAAFLLLQGGAATCLCQKAKLAYQRGLQCQGKGQVAFDAGQEYNNRTQILELKGPLMGDKIFIILQQAVQLARDEQIKTVSALRARLLQLYPGEDTAVAEALDVWAGYANKTVGTEA
jgi:hypothetical protein